MLLPRWPGRRHRREDDSSAEVATPVPVWHAGAAMQARGLIHSWPGRLRGTRDGRGSDASLLPSRRLGGHKGHPLQVRGPDGLDSTRLSPHEDASASHAGRMSQPRLGSSALDPSPPLEMRARGTVRDQPGAWVEGSAAAHHAPDSCHQLLGALFLLRVRAANDAVVRVVVEQAQGNLVERGLSSGDLRQDVDAVAVVLDHPLDAAHLPLDATQPLQQLVLGCRVAARLACCRRAHAATIPYTPRGYGTFS